MEEVFNVWCAVCTSCRDHVAVNDDACWIMTCFEVACHLYGWMSWEKLKADVGISNAAKSLRGASHSNTARLISVSYILQQRSWPRNNANKSKNFMTRHQNAQQNHNPRIFGMTVIN